MDNRFVHLSSRIDCDWGEESPAYRLYVNDELFSERTWIWRDDCLEENIIVYAEPGDYAIRYELVEPHTASLIIGSLTVVEGLGEVIDNENFRITA